MKKIELAGLGMIHLNGVDFKENEGVNTDREGNELSYKLEGESRTGKYYRLTDGAEIPRSEVCKSFLIDGEKTTLSKLKPTLKIDSDVITISEQDGSAMLAMDRKIYVIMTDSVKIKEELDKGNQITFPLVVGAGFKIWKGVLKNHTTQSGKKVIAMFAVRGNMEKAFEMFSDEPVEIELGIMPEENKQNMKKVFASIGC